METKRGVHIFKISFLLILFCITVLNVSGFSVKELLEKSSYGIVSITGMGSTGISSVNLTLLGRNPVISLVYNTSIQSITDNSFTNVTISFEINDPDGVDTISADRARINLTKKAEARDHQFIIIQVQHQEGALIQETLTALLPI